MVRPELNLADRPTLSLLRQRILQTLKPLGEELGIEFCTESGNFAPDGSQYIVKLACNRGSAEAAARVEFARLSLLFGLTPDHFGQEFTTSTGRYALCGINPKSHKYPFLGKRPDGKIYKFSRDTVMRALAPQAQ